MATLQLDLLPGAFQAHKSVSSLYQALTFLGAQPWAAERKQSQCSNFSNFIPSILSSLKWDRKCAAHSSTALPGPCGTGIFSPLGIRAVPCSYCHHQEIAQWDKANRWTWSQTLKPLQFAVQVQLPSVVSQRTKTERMRSMKYLPLLYMIMSFLHIYMQYTHTHINAGHTHTYMQYVWVMIAVGVIAWNCLPIVN